MMKPSTRSNDSVKKVQEIRPSTAERPVVQLQPAETQHLLELAEQLQSIQADRVGALKLLVRQHGLQGSYSLSDDCLTLTPVETSAPPAHAA